LKKVVTTIALLGVLVLTSAAFAGNGAGLNARLAHLDARVAKYHQKCDAANAPARCAAVKARLTARLTKVEAKLDARIVKRQHNTARVATLQSARDHIASLLASL
jgi:hypothetical protein